MYTLQKGRIRKTEMKPNTATPMETSAININGATPGRVPARGQRLGTGPQGAGGPAGRIWPWERPTALFCFSCWLT